MAVRSAPRQAKAWRELGSPDWRTSRVICTISSRARHRPHLSPKYSLPRQKNLPPPSPGSGILRSLPSRVLTCLTWWKQLTVTDSGPTSGRHTKLGHRGHRSAIKCEARKQSRHATCPHGGTNMGRPGSISSNLHPHMAQPVAVR
ncbi:hypothetical protein CDD83_9451 [Cordyceps sp. RAO-2017]|nr:hypothetical protein CDD83_9451 [Cordyceps sp. RAO-2017]